MYVDLKPFSDYTMKDFVHFEQEKILFSADVYEKNYFWPVFHLSLTSQQQQESPEMRSVTKIRFLGLYTF
jgi:hypothetical protein